MSKIVQNPRAKMSNLMSKIIVFVNPHGWLDKNLIRLPGAVLPVSWQCLPLKMMSWLTGASWKHMAEHTITLVWVEHPDKQMTCRCVPAVLDCCFSI